MIFYNNFINMLHPKINVTTELEQDNNINFLDITINNLARKLDF